MSVLMRTSILARLLIRNSLASHRLALIHTSKCLLNSSNKSSMFTIQPPTSKQTAESKIHSDSANEFEKHYERIANETLESLTERFDRLADELEEIEDDFDVMFSNGVLTFKLGGSLGTYVINKQTPNLQIWFSSPTSGPKRFDYIDDTWVYKRTGETLHGLLASELSRAFKKNIDLSNCSFTPKK